MEALNLFLLQFPRFPLVVILGKNLYGLTAGLHGLVKGFIHPARDRHMRSKFWH
jgi:hypothetical protein